MVQDVLAAFYLHPERPHLAPAALSSVARIDIDMKAPEAPWAVVGVAAAAHPATAVTALEIFYRPLKLASHCRSDAILTRPAGHGHKAPILFPPEAVIEVSHFPNGAPMTDSQPDTIYDFEAVSIDGRPIPLAEYRGKVALIVNVASRCGFTQQYESLESLYRELEPEGFVVLAFPCNQFGGQEPGSDSEIAQFCSLEFGVTFPVFGKIDVNGEDAHPLFRYLKAECPGTLGTEAIKWNFTKFVVDRNGKVVDRHSPATSPSSLKPQLVKLLEKPI